MSMSGGACKRKRSAEEDEGLFRGRAALVTGGGSGIGRATALAFAREGASVVVADVDADLAAKTCELANQERQEPVAFPFCCDVSSMEEVKKLVAFAVEKLGGLHHCLNNAGIEGNRAQLHEQTFEDWSRVMGVNAGGVFNCMSREVAQMLKQCSAEGEAGRLLKRDPSPYAPKAIDSENLTIVNMSSSAGQNGMPEFSPYCASKHAVIGLTKAAAKEYASRGIRVNCICPSTTSTPMVQRFTDRWPDWQAKQNASFPTGRVGTAEEVAEAVLWLSSPSCPMVCGACLTIDGAHSA